MNPSDVDIKNIKVEDNYVNYNGERIIFQTEWTPTYFMQKYKTLKVILPKEGNILRILKDIDEKVGKYIPEKCKQTRIVKEYEGKEYVQPKYKYTKVYDENKNEKDIKELERENIECRFIFAISPIKRFQNYYGSHLKCVQIQVRQKKVAVFPFMFDD